MSKGNQGNDGSPKWVHSDGSESDSSQDSPESRGRAVPTTPRTPARPGVTSPVWIHSDGESPQVSSPPVRGAEGGIPIPPPPPPIRGPRRPAGERPENPPYMDRNFQLSDSLQSRGVWDEETRSYKYGLPPYMRKQNYPGDADFPQQKAISIADDTYQSIVPEGAERQPYRSYNFRPGSTWATLTDRRGRQENVAVPNNELTFYPPPRPIFPETTGIGRTNQPTRQEVPPNLRYAAYGPPNQPWSRSHPSTRIRPAGRPIPQPEEQLRGTPMEEVGTNLQIVGRNWDPDYRGMHPQGLEYRISPYEKRKKPMPPVRAMPPLHEDEELDMDEVDPDAPPRPAYWNARSRRVVEMHHGHYDRTDGHRLRGVKRTDKRLPPPHKDEDTDAEEDYSKSSSRSRDSGAGGSSGSGASASAFRLPATPPPSDSSSHSSNASGESLEEVEEAVDALEDQENRNRQPKKSSSIMDNIKGFFKKK